MTLTLDAELIEAIDAIKQQTAGKSRSAVIEKILRPWYHAQLQKKIDRETEAYYLALSDEEQEEDQQWTQLTGTQIDRLWN
ncbi:MAG: ribbon-helix-helix protein, CopG family [Candidatus Poribacteria bacterium]|nr:ribbon-helix-helix protein, CopG family [Candidatus Poribacteria bacterium]